MSGLMAGSGIIAIVFMTMMALPAQAAQPSFDCDGAKSEVERMICGDDALADLDLRLAKDFARVEGVAATGSPMSWPTTSKACSLPPPARFLRRYSWTGDLRRWTSTKA